MFVTFSLSTKLQAKEDPSFWNLQEILTRAEQHLAAIQLLAETNPTALEAQLDILSGETCAANALRISRHALLAYSGDEGWAKVFEMTKDMFGPLVKPFGLDLDLVEDISELIDLLNSEDEDAFTEALARLVVRKVVEGGIDQLPEAFNQGVNANELEAPFSDYLTDEAKRRAKELYESYLFPDDKELFTYSYDPGKIQGWGTIINFIGNIAVGETQCPVTATGTLTTYETDDGDIPGVTITVTGNCDCKWPKDAFPRTQLDDFTVTIYLSLRNNGNGYSVNPKEIEYEVEATCCGEDISYQDDPYTFLSPESLLIGSQSSICYEINNDSPNELMYTIGSNSQYALSSSTLLGLGLGYSNDATYGEADNVQSTKLALIKPSFILLPPCFDPEGSEKNWRPAIRANLLAGIGSYTNDFGGSSTIRDDIVRFGGSIDPGILFNPRKGLYLGMYFHLFSYSQTRFSNEFTAEPFVDKQFKFGFNKPGLGMEVLFRF